MSSKTWSWPALQRTATLFPAAGATLLDAGGLGVEVRDDGMDGGVRVDLEFEGFYDAMPVWTSRTSASQAGWCGFTACHQVR